MKKILIITSSVDLTVDYVINKYNQHALFYRFNTDYFQDYEIIVGNQEGWIIKNKYWIINEGEIDAIYYRKPVFPKLDEYNSMYHNMMYKEILTAIIGIIEVFKGRCLTKPSILRNAENKIVQMSIAREIGFRLPQSCITNSPNEARKFYNSNISIVKPISVGKVISGDKIEYIQTNMVDEDFNIEDIRLSPCYFQQYIKKDFEVRVTVINSIFYTVKIDSSDKVDWRKTSSNNIYNIIELPGEIKEQCSRMLRIMGLDFGAFDFIVSNNEYYFLEVNPNGQWYWLEDILHLDISKSVFEYLAGEV
ncbi:hypothetical protein G9F71_022555 [Clostridium sp. FP2]|uniref:MvdC/MvdD family ATP grasp protein n=1 Tax=Clostridium sp. FP2 TaxID=2724481 RepID=UPI0013E944F3|nr:hypothetical protein [Clostridium sp. FP2]MBZ9625614.1 hypothetical protein [Clostridium sp. FP2]